VTYDKNLFVRCFSFSFIFKDELLTGDEVILFMINNKRSNVKVENEKTTHASVKRFLLPIISTHICIYHITKTCGYIE